MNGTLIRDKVPSIIEAKGETCNYVEIKSAALHSNMLRDKLVETVNAFLQANTVETLVEVKTVVEAIADEARDAFDSIYVKQLEELGSYVNHYAYLQANYGAQVETTKAEQEAITEQQENE